MKKLFIIYVIAASIGFSSCTGLFGEGQLDMAPVEDINEDKIFSDYAMFRQYADQAYSYMPGHLGRLWNSLVSSMGDESRNKGGCTAIFNNGAWDGTRMDTSNKMVDANNEISDMWQNMYIGIRKANKIIENIDRIPNFPSDEIKDRCLGEAYFLRAFFYFELIKRWGGVPIIDHTLVLNQDNLDLPRDTYEKCVEFIENDCKTAAGLLPLKYADADNGRASKGAALALRSRTLLYAARQLHNPTNDIAKWEKAATAAYELITKGWYSLPKINKDPLYDANGGNEVLNSPQLIFERRNSASNNFEENNLPISYEQGKTGNVPTQNLVDAFQTKDGKDFDWNSGDDPYANRDPRFYRTILCNGDTWMKQTIESYEGGKDGEGTEGATKTGYYLKKYMNETVSLDPSKPVTKEHHYILFRYAEVLLNYAEAMAEWKGESYTDDKHTMTATAALNQVRNAANMPNITTTGDAFKESVRRERRVELAFEDHRFWDIRRWKIGEQTQKIYRTKITKQSDGSFRYEKVLLEERNWEDKMYLYPIPLSEQILNNNLGQNPGW